MSYTRTTLLPRKLNFEIMTIVRQYSGTLGGRGIIRQVRQYASTILWASAGPYRLLTFACRGTAITV